MSGRATWVNDAWLVMALKGNNVNSWEAPNHTDQWLRLESRYRGGLLGSDLGGVTRDGEIKRGAKRDATSVYY